MFGVGNKVKRAIFYCYYMLLTGFYANQSRHKLHAGPTGRGTNFLILIPHRPQFWE